MTIVSRSMAPDAPADSMFPNVPEAHHGEDCVIGRDYACTCGLFAFRLAAGHFVKYDSSMCRVPQKPPTIGALACLQDFLEGLKAKTAAIDMVAWRKEEEKEVRSNDKRWKKTEP